MTRSPSQNAIIGALSGPPGHDACSLRHSLRDGVYSATGQENSVVQRAQTFLPPITTSEGSVATTREGKCDGPGWIGASAIGDRRRRRGSYAAPADGFAPSDGAAPIQITMRPSTHTGRRALATFDGGIGFH